MNSEHDVLTVIKMDWNNDAQNYAVSARYRNFLEPVRRIAKILDLPQNAHPNRILM
ncbi:MAG: hypothetical protein R3F08_14545 [Dokdonella sp.]